MTSVLWKHLYQCYGIIIKFSSAHHLKTDSQTENVKKVMKNYLRAYISHVQDDWIDHLPMAKFAVNNHINASISIMQFFANNSFHPQIGIEPLQAYQKAGRRAELLAADKIVANQEQMASFLQDQLA